MLNRTARSIVSAVAPTLGSALGSPLAGAAIQTIGKTVLGKAGVGADEVDAFLENAGGEELEALKKAEADFLVEMERLNVEIYKVDADDRADARDSFAEFRVAIFVLGAFILTIWAVMNAGVLFAVAKYDVDPAALGVLQRPLGTLDGMALTVVAFYFGSALGSKLKDRREAKAFEPPRAG